MRPVALGLALVDDAGALGHRRGIQRRHKVGKALFNFRAHAFWVLWIWHPLACSVTRCGRVGFAVRLKFSLGNRTPCNAVFAHHQRLWLVSDEVGLAVAVSGLHHAHRHFAATGAGKVVVESVEPFVGQCPSAVRLRQVDDEIVRLEVR